MLLNSKTSVFARFLLAIDSEAISVEKLERRKRKKKLSLHPDNFGTPQKDELLWSFDHDLYSAFITNKR